MIVIENGLVWNGKRDDPPARRTIIIQDKFIRHVVPPDESTTLSEETERIDASTRFIMPGLINAHIHICFDGSQDPVSTMLREGVARTAIKAAIFARRTLLKGITTIRDLGGWQGIDIALRNALNDEVVTGPRMLVSGRPFCMTGGHLHFMGCEVDGPNEARKGVRTQLKCNVDLIKVMATGGCMTDGTEPGSPQLTVEEMKVIVEEAKKAGKRVACHAHGNKGISNAIEAGVTSIEHGTFLDDQTVDKMIEKDIHYTPTLIAQHNTIAKGAQGGVPRYIVRRAQEMVKPRMRSIQLAYDKGVKIIPGTDSGTPLNPHGNLLDELLLLKKEIMTARDILVASTSMAARALGIDDILGTLDEGKIADLIILDGNPLDDLEALGKVHLIIKNGRKILPENTAQL